jgi:hypothetical protein
MLLITNKAATQLNMEITIKDHWKNIHQAFNPQTC